MIFAGQFLKRCPRSLQKLQTIVFSGSRGAKYLDVIYDFWSATGRFEGFEVC